MRPQRVGVDTQGGSQVRIGVLIRLKQLVRLVVADVGEFHGPLVAQLMLQGHVPQQRRRSQ